MGLMTTLAQFSLSLDGVKSFEYGPNHDFEQKSPHHNAGFVVKFHDKTALDTYAHHPTHQKLGAELCTLCNRGADGIIVYDLAT
jgi:hypothetical protein